MYIGDEYTTLSIGMAIVGGTSIGRVMTTSDGATPTHRSKTTPGAKTINVFRACLGAQLTSCAQK